MIEWTVVGSNPKKIPVRRVRRMGMYHYPRGYISYSKVLIRVLTS